MTEHLFILLRIVQGVAALNVSRVVSIEMKKGTTKVLWDY